MPSTKDAPSQKRSLLRRKSSCSKRPAARKDTVDLDAMARQLHNLQLPSHTVRKGAVLPSPQCDLKESPSGRECNRSTFRTERTASFSTLSECGTPIPGARFEDLCDNTGHCKSAPELTGEEFLLSGMAKLLERQHRKMMREQEEQEGFRDQQADPVRGSSVTASLPRQGSPSPPKAQKTSSTNPTTCYDDALPHLKQEGFRDPQADPVRGSSVTASLPRQGSPSPSPPKAQKTSSTNPTCYDDALPCLQHLTDESHSSFSFENNEDQHYLYDHEVALREASRNDHHHHRSYAQDPYDDRQGYASSSFPSQYLTTSRSSSRQPQETRHYESRSTPNEKKLVPSAPDTTALKPSPQVPAEVKVEVEPGLFENLRGSQETMQAVNDGSARNATCWACENFLKCVPDCKLIICPDCRVISPVDLPADDIYTPFCHGVGLGYKQSIY